MRMPPLTKSLTVLMLVSAAGSRLGAQDIARKLLTDYPISVVNAEGGVVKQGVTLKLKSPLMAGTPFCLHQRFQELALSRSPRWERPAAARSSANR